MTIYTKDPNARLDYTWDWTDWLADGDTIASHIVIVVSGDVVVDSTVADATSVKVWLSGGTNGENAKVTVRITTQQTRTDDRTATFQIRQR